LEKRRKPPASGLKTKADWGSWVRGLIFTGQEKKGVFGLGKAYYPKGNPQTEVGGQKEKHDNDKGKRR